MASGRKHAGRWYCREHEVQILNLDRGFHLSKLAEGIEIKDECWIYRDYSRKVKQERDPSKDYTPDGYAKFSVTGTGGQARDKKPWEDPKQSYWLAHRVAWGLLMGGTKQNRQLDHLDDCQSRACVNPAHLEPVTPAVNKKRQHARNRVAKGIETRTVRACGQRFNKDAAATQDVIDFARTHGLPLPAVS